MLRRRRVAFLALATILFSSLASPALARSSEYSRLRETKRKLRAARTRLNAARRTDAELMSTIRAVGDQLDSAKTLLSAAQDQLASLELQIQAHQRQLLRLSNQRDQRLKAFSKRISAMYMMGPGAEASALIGAATLQDFADKSSAMDFVLRSDRINVESLATLSDHTAKAKAQLADEAAQAQLWRRRVSERVALVWDALSTHKAAEAQLAGRVRAYRNEVQALEQEQRHIEDIIFQRGSYGTGPVSVRGLIWPVRSHHINSPYGPRWGGFHTGVDIQCASGEADWAAKAGKVIAAEWGGGYGNMVIVDHGGGVSTLYAHNSRLLVHEGEQVDRGQQIADCGSTGNSTGAHLHFEVRINGHHVNPMPYLP